MSEEELRSSFSQLKIEAVICASDDCGDAARSAAAAEGVWVLHYKPGSGSSPTNAFPSLFAAPGQKHQQPAAKVYEDTLLLEGEDRMVLLLRTSGTTSKGRVVPFNLRRLSAAAQYNSSYIGLAPGEVCLSMMPLYHIAGISVNLLPSLFAGATVLLLDGPFQASAFVAQLGEMTSMHLLGTSRCLRCIPPS
jgi:acyl-CoA synthetase (AMP-forming)/AMP-acid ligase II